MHPAPSTLTIPSDITVDRTSVRTAYGENSEFARRWFRILGKEVEEGSFRPMKAHIMERGLASVDEGLGMLERGEVNGEKLVCKLFAPSCSLRAITQ